MEDIYRIESPLYMSHPCMQYHARTIYLTQVEFFGSLAIDLYVRSRKSGISGGVPVTKNVT